MSQGVVTVCSPHAHAETLERVVKAVKRAGMTVFSQIDHAAAAAAEGLPLNPTAVVIFGSARAGTPLMRLNPLVAIDLPLRILVWEDGLRAAWLSYNDPLWIARRHSLPDNGGPGVLAMASALQSLAQYVVAEPAD